MTALERRDLTGAALLSAVILSGCAVFRDPPEDAELASAVRAQFWQRALRVNSISVNARDRVVYLSGLVDTPLEVDQSGRIASEVAGVARVVNNLVDGP